MTDRQAWILLALCLFGGGRATYDLISVRQTGRARGRWGSTITRNARPKAFQIWMISQCVMVALFAAGLVWAAMEVGEMVALGSKSAPPFARPCYLAFAAFSRDGVCEFAAASVRANNQMLGASRR